jgi:hypothetical protein
MLGAVRQIEAQVDCQSTPVSASQRCVFGALSSGVHMIDAAQASSEQVRAKKGECGCMWLWVSILKVGGALSREPGTGHHVGGSEADRGASWLLVNASVRESTVCVWGIEQRRAHD